jgi:hypothetical protein
MKKNVLEEKIHGTKGGELPGVLQRRLPMWVVSYPKSGNTWMRTMIREYYRAKYRSTIFETADTAMAWYQGVMTAPLSVVSVEHLAMARPAAMLNLKTFIESYGHIFPAATIKSHMLAARYDEIPFFCPLWCNQVLYILRDPRDMVASFSVHMNTDISTCVTAVTHDSTTIGTAPEVVVPVGSWATHVKSWEIVQEQGKINVMILRYEDMHEDPEGSLTKVLEHFNIEVDEDAVKMAVEASSFDKLRDQEDQYGFHEAPKRPDAKFFREGKVGGWKGKLSKKDRKTIESHAHDLMVKYGYLEA